MGNRTRSLAPPRPLAILLCAFACADPATSDDVQSTSESTQTGDPQATSTGVAEGTSDAGSDTHGPSDSDASSSGDTGAANDCDDFDAFVAALSAAEPTDRIALTDAFVRVAQYSEHGLPLRCEGRLVALAWQEGDEPLALTGDFSDWDPTAHPFVAPIADFGLRIADIAVEEPLAPSLYKLVQGDDTFVADPWARRFGWDELGEYSLTDARGDVGHHERWPAFAEAVGALEPRDVVVYLPAGALAQRELAVLYMHDGQNLFAPDAAFGGWHVGAAVDDARGTLPPMMVVGIDNTDARFAEYTQVEDDIGRGLVGGRADEYADFVALGVKPFIDARYPTRNDREATAVLGSSLGGLVSLYIASRHPDVFAYAGSMSGTLDWGRIGADNDRIVELYGAEPPDDLWVYLDSGGDGPCPGGGDDNYCVTIEMRDRLVELGWSEPSTLVYAHTPGATHDEAAWAARLPGFLAALGDAWSRGE